MNSTAKIILLNGVGSAGKSSIARALQAVTAEPFLHVQLDTFMDMLPEAYHQHPDGFTYKTMHEDGQPLVAIEVGRAGARALRGMRHAVAALAGQGNNLIVDDVMLGSTRAEYASLLSAFKPYWVGVIAPLDVLEAREIQRGDRLIGLARWQYKRVHKGMDYDLEIDTSCTSPADCAMLIKEKFQL